MRYRNLDTMEVYTESELEAIYHQFEDEMDYEDFEDYFEDMLAKGREGTGGLVSAHWYAVQSNGKDNSWETGSYNLDEAFDMLRKYPEGKITVFDMVDEWDIPVAVGVLAAEDDLRTTRNTEERTNMNTIYKVREDIGMLADELTYDPDVYDMRWNTAEVKIDAENFGMTPQEFIDKFLEEAN